MHFLTRSRKMIIKKTLAIRSFPNYWITRCLLLLIRGGSHTTAWPPPPLQQSAGVSLKQMVRLQLWIFTVAQQCSIYICSLHTTRPQDNGTPRGIWLGNMLMRHKHFLQEIMNVELLDIHSFNLYLDSTGDKPGAGSHFQVRPVRTVTVKNCANSSKWMHTNKKKRVRSYGEMKYVKRK